MQVETTADAEGDCSARGSHCTGPAAAALKPAQTRVVSLDIGELLTEKESL